MNSMWNCPQCTQMLNRGWNIQTHFLRKHNGFGTPINLIDNSVQLSIEKDVIMELKPVGQSELQNEIQRTIKMITDRKEIANITTKTSQELDEEELKKYLEHVVRKVKKKD